MPDRNLANLWCDEFYRLLQQPETGGPLREAAAGAKLGAWTSHLTGVVVSSCQSLGWRPTAKGFRSEHLPIPGSEYLALDAMAFPQSAGRWSLPLAIFELENSPTDDRVAYSLWKVLCVRVSLRVVIAYRRDVEEGVALVHRLASSPIGDFSIEERLKTPGETALIVGNRGGAETFPYGYFKAWTLDRNTGRFERA
jgi:hypothetical protein